MPEPVDVERAMDTARHAVLAASAASLRYWRKNVVVDMKPDRKPVTAADSDAEAIAALKRAAETTQGLKPVAAEARDLFRRPLAASELTSFDAVVFDPPRQGAEAQARALAASSVPVVVAVSCNPATFARDARILADGGYRLTRVTAVDQFRYSPHVEIAARLER